MRLGRIADPISTVIQHAAQQDTGVEPCATDQEVVRRPFAPFILPPGFAQPFTVGLKAACRQYAGPGFNALRGHGLAIDLMGANVGGDKFAVLELNVGHLRVVADLDAQAFGTAEISIDQGFTAAHEKGVGPRHMQRA